MFPKLDGIDHIHVYVSDREKAAIWYEKHLGFKVNPTFEFWAENERGPLMIEDQGGKIHLALFNTKNLIPTTAIAFKTDSSGFLAWKSHLEEADLLLRCSDHTKSWSLYFNDLDGNMHEITTYDYDDVSGQLKSV